VKQGSKISHKRRLRGEKTEGKAGAWGERQAKTLEGGEGKRHEKGEDEGKGL